jgi:hypothetical protein
MKNRRVFIVGGIVGLINGGAAFGSKPLAVSFWLLAASACDSRLVIPISACR